MNKNLILVSLVAFATLFQPIQMNAQVGALSLPAATSGVALGPEMEVVAGVLLVVEVIFEGAKSSNGTVSSTGAWDMIGTARAALVEGYLRPSGITLKSVQWINVPGSARWHKSYAKSGTNGPKCPWNYVEISKQGDGMFDLYMNMPDGSKKLYGRMYLDKKWSGAGAGRVVECLVWEIISPKGIPLSEIDCNCRSTGRPVEGHKIVKK